jgi:hypothetical protein
MAVSPAVNQRALLVALRPWTRRLALEALLRWTIRGGIAALAAACLVLSVGWLTAFPMNDLRPVALQLALPALLVGMLVGLWPKTRLSRAAELDARLLLKDRLATAWLERRTGTAMAELQRGDALRTLAERVRGLHVRMQRTELVLLAAMGVLTLALGIVPSPQEKVLQQIAAEEAATQRAADRLDALRQDAILADSLTPEQARRLDELLQRARQELGQTHTEKAAAALLARAEQELLQLGDPNADARDQALAAMSETLAKEPLARGLGDALERNDPSATKQAVQEMRDRAGSLSEPQRQALAKALQRAANVGRADPGSSTALRDAARALGSGENSDEALDQASVSLEDAMRAAASEAALRSASQRLRDVRTEMSQAALGERPSDQSLPNDPAQTAYMPGSLSGTAVPIDSSQLRRGGATSQGQAEPASERSRSGGVSGAELSQGQSPDAPAASENIFIPGLIGEGASDNDVIQQPFSVRGAPRPYREVIGQYAQSGRDYVDRATVSPMVRDLVRQYFADLEGQ